MIRPPRESSSDHRRRRGIHSTFPSIARKRSQPADRRRAGAARRGPLRRTVRRRFRRWLRGCPRRSRRVRLGRRSGGSVGIGGRRRGGSRGAGVDGCLSRGIFRHGGRLRGSWAVRGRQGDGRSAARAEARSFFQLVLEVRGKHALPFHSVTPPAAVPGGYVSVRIHDTTDAVRVRACVGDRPQAFAAAQGRERGVS